jgi:aminobenzoyl-glutamate utilization protein B
MLRAMKDAAFDWIDESSPSLREMSHRIWEYAELGLREFKSSKLLSDELANNGFMVERGVAQMPTAFVASWGRGQPIIGIMGEFDALPGLSQKGVPWREPLVPEAPGHGCGHNIYGTSGMAGAIAAKKAMEHDKLNGTIKFFGCPAEENFCGKVYMVRDGYFNGVDVVLGHHPNTMNEASLRSCLAMNSAKFHFRGKAAHAGGSPEQGRSALDAVELMNVGVNYLREHIIQDARIHYVIEKGGMQPNIVPEYARSWYYVRAPEREQVESIYDWVLEIAEGAAKMTRTKAEVEFLEGMYNLVANKTVAELVVKNMREVGLPKYSDEDLKFAAEIFKTIPSESKLQELRKSGRPGWQALADKMIDDEIPSPWGEDVIGHGSTDVADVSWQVPVVEFGTATWVLGTPGHSWQSAAQSTTGLGDKSLIFAAKVMAGTTIDLLSTPQVIDKAKTEHRARIANKVYRSPIPPDSRPPLYFWGTSAP